MTQTNSNAKKELSVKAQVLQPQNLLEDSMMPTNIHIQQSKHTRHKKA